MIPNTISNIAIELKKIHEQISFFENSLSVYSLNSGNIKDLAYLTLLQRIKSEFYSAFLLFEQIKKDGENLYPSMGLLLRACLMDVTMYYYLTSFEKDENTFRTEVDVTDIDFFNNINKLKEIEEIKPEEDGLKSILQKEFAHLLKNIEECCFYKIPEYREKSNIKKSLYCPNFEFNCKSVTDETKFKQILHFYSVKDISLIKARYKLFSQFQHFSYSGSKLFGSNDDEMLDLIITSFVLVSVAIMNMLQIYKLEVIQLEIKECISNIEQHSMKS